MLEKADVSPRPTTPEKEPRRPVFVVGISMVLRLRSWPARFGYSATKANRNTALGVPPMT